jgi:adenylate cyclase
LKAYRGSDWTGAAHLLQELLVAHPASGLYQLFSQRVEHFMQTPPPGDWDGSTKFDVK